MKVLWLCSWYPNKLRPFDGDFIQRHAKAVSLLHQVHVCFIKKDEEGVITSKFKEESFSRGNLTETIIYYKPLKTGISFIDKIISDNQYKKVYKKYLHKYISANGKPKFVHVHVAFKASLAAIWLKKNFNIPFLISEHWSGYLPEAHYGYKDFSKVNRIRLKNIFREAERLTVVSMVLGDAIMKNFAVEKFSVIPNVVDTEIFYPSNEAAENKVVKFIHISSLNIEKNVEETISAFSIVRDKGYNFSLTIYGPNKEHLIKLCTGKNLDALIMFKGEIEQAMLAEEIRKHDALVLFSKYETFGCVVIEANACGLPAILTDLPVFREYVLENKTGTFAASNTANDLAEAIIYFINNREKFNKKEIAEYAKSNFQYSKVAADFDKIYNEIKTKF